MPIDSLESASAVNVYSFRRAYALMVILNVNRPQLRDPAIRRALNAAIDREALVRDILRGHGTPARGPVWPEHWAFTGQMPQFQYDPQPLAPKARVRFTGLVLEPTHERLALAVQRQLRSVGAELDLEMVSMEDGMQRVGQRRFGRGLHGRQSRGRAWSAPRCAWHSGGPQNIAGYRVKAVDAALSAVAGAADDTAYAGRRRGVPAGGYC